jgi:hypothetical protein
MMQNYKKIVLFEERKCEYRKLKLKIGFVFLKKCVFLQPQKRRGSSVG